MPKIDIGDIDIKTDTYETTRQLTLTGITGQPNAVYEVYTSDRLYIDPYYGKLISPNISWNYYSGEGLYKSIVQADSSGRMYFITSARVWEKHRGRWAYQTNKNVTLYSKNKGYAPNNEEQMKSYGGYMILRLDGRTSSD